MAKTDRAVIDAILEQIKEFAKNNGEKVTADYIERVQKALNN